MAREPAQRTVLVVEDDGEVREVMVEHLALNGYAVLEAASGIEALLQLRGARPDVVVLDLNMPRLGGLEAIRRTHAFDPTIVVVALAEEADDEVYWRALELGALDVLPTPVVMADLLAILESAEPTSDTHEDEALSLGLAAPGRTVSASRRVLVISDDPAVRAALEEFLTDRGYQAASASHATATLEAVVEAPPDVVVLDISTEGLSEIEALPAVRALTPHVTVILIGAVTDTEIARRGLARGAFDFIAKPPDLESLTDSMEAGLELWRLTG